jgi:hypothetical protein
LMLNVAFAMTVMIVADKCFSPEAISRPPAPHGYRVDMELPLGSWVNRRLIAAMVTAVLTR